MCLVSTPGEEVMMPRVEILRVRKRRWCGSYIQVACRYETSSLEFGFRPDFDLVLYLAKAQVKKEKNC